MREFLTLGSRGIDISGRVFGRLTVIGPVRRLYSSSGTVVIWLCVCACGTEKEIRGNDLRRGVQVSCGCHSAEVSSRRLKTHGQARTGRVTGEYKSWQDMRARCLNPKNSSFENYGGRGITVDARWDSYEAFIADMGSRPTPKHTLERIDVNKGYGPNNCRWATKTEQSKNTRRSRHVTYNGRTQIAADWAREVGLRPQILNGRLRDGWSVEKALFTPLQINAKRARRSEPSWSF